MLLSRPRQYRARVSWHFLARSQYHHHSMPFQRDHGFNLTDFADFVANPFQHTHPQFLVSHFTTTETQSHFDLVAIIDETLHITQLDLVVAFIRTGTEFDFLDLNDFLLGLGFLLALLFLIAEFAVIHQTPHRWHSRRGDFHQVHIMLFCHSQGVRHLDDT